LLLPLLFCAVSLTYSGHQLSPFASRQLLSFNLTHSDDEEATQPLFMINE
jgi:hypothetical protein